MASYHRYFINLYCELGQPNAWAGKQLGGYILYKNPDETTSMRCLFCNESQTAFFFASEEKHVKRTTMAHVKLCSEQWARARALDYYLDKLSNTQIDQFNLWISKNYHTPVIQKWLIPVYGPNTNECLAIEVMCHAFASFSG